MLEQAIDGAVQIVGRHHLVDKADAQRLGRVKALAGQKVALPGTGAHGPQHVGGDGGGDQANLHFRQAKVRLLHRHGHVAGGHQAHAPGVHIALHAGDGGVRAGGNGVQHGGQLACVGQVFFAGVVGHGPHPVEVGPGAKGRAFGGQHHGADIVTLADFGKRGGDFGNHHIAESVADFRLAQGEGGNPGIHGSDDGTGHGSAPCFNVAVTCGRHRTWCPQSVHCAWPPSPAPARGGCRPGRSHHRPTGGRWRSRGGPGLRTAGGWGL